MARKSANGSGSIRKKIITRNGTKYTYWEGRYTIGRDGGTGKIISKSIYGKTQKEVAQKLKSITSEIDAGTYKEPQKMLLKEWLIEWEQNYLGNNKPLTIAQYHRQIKNHIIPEIGAISLNDLSTSVIQKFYKRAENNHSNPLSARTIINIHSVLHKSLDQAVRIGYIKANPCDNCILPKIKKADISPLSADEISMYLLAAQNENYCNLFVFALFSGMRQGEILGLSWDNVDFENGKVNVCQQLQINNGEYIITTPKSGKSRIIYLANIAMDALKSEKTKQEASKKEAGEYWQNSMNLVFTDSLGNPIPRRNIDYRHKHILKEAGLKDIRFHDLRHTYAVSSIQAGDDIKTIQENLGHATASFTLDVYSHSIDDMKRNSAERMQKFVDKNVHLGKEMGNKKAE